MVTRTRTELFTIRMTADELAMVQRLAEADGISASDLVRQFVRRSFAERFGAEKPRPKRKR